MEKKREELIIKVVLRKVPSLLLYSTTDINIYMDMYGIHTMDVWMYGYFCVSDIELVLKLLPCIRKQ